MKRGKRIQSRRPPASGRKPSSRLAARDVVLSAKALVEFQALFAEVFQRREQRWWWFLYLCGQLSNLERKTIEPIVLGLQGADTNAIRALQHHIGQGHWDSRAMLWQIQALSARWLGTPDGVLIVDGSGFPKQGNDSVGVARQYCGHLGKVANCQEGVFLLYASQHSYAFLDERLYLPENWFEKENQARWRACEIPKDVAFCTEGELALEMIRGLTGRSIVPYRWVTADEHFGQNLAFLQGISALGKWYLVEVPSDTRFWSRRPGLELPGPGWLGRPRLYVRVARSAPSPREIREIGKQLPRSAWKPYTIKEGGRGPLLAEFAFLRLVTVQDKLPGERVWIILRRTLSSPEIVKYYISNAPTSCTPTQFVWASGMRWPIETALEEAKGEVGMDHYETRTWRGWHHHMAQTFAAHLFLIHLRLLFKKKSGADHCSSPCADRPSHRRRMPTTLRHHPYHPLSTMQKLCRLLFSSQTDTQKTSPPILKTEIARNLVVMKISL